MILAFEHSHTTHTDLCSSHNKADCTNPRVEREFTGTCNSCGVQGHAARNCPSNPMKCKLCDQEGHKAVDCKSRRIVNWTGVPELEADEAWTKLVDAATTKDLDLFRVSLRAYARALIDGFSLVAVEEALRQDKLPIYLIAKEQEIAQNMTIVDLIGNPDRKFVLSIQLMAKPRRAKMAQGWPEDSKVNLERLASAGFVHDCGVPLCSNCNELGHIRKHCKQEQVERESNSPAIICVYCQESGHRARDCKKERINPYACKNCKQEGHNAKECPEPRSAENVECRKCNETGHFSRDVSAHLSFATKTNNCAVPQCRGPSSAYVPQLWIRGPHREGMRSASQSGQRDVPQL